MGEHYGGRRGEGGYYKGGFYNLPGGGGDYEGGDYEGGGGFQPRETAAVVPV